MSDTNSFSATRARKKCGGFAETTAFERYGVKGKLKSQYICIMSTGLPRPGLVRSAHRGRIKLLRGYVSKSSAALNPLTITQLACELSMRGRSRTALLGPSHQLAVRMRIMRIIAPRMRSAYTCICIACV